jgi:hypothetical protein
MNSVLLLLVVYKKKFVSLTSPARCLFQYVKLRLAVSPEGSTAPRVTMDRGV